MSWVPVQGRSMSPFLDEGDEVEVDWREPSAAGPGATQGELIVARGVDREWVVHRVVESGPKSFRSKGDAALAWDDFDAGQVWGKIIGVRKMGRESRFVAGTLDRWIARLSGHAAAMGGGLATRLIAAAARRSVRALGRLRRGIL